MNNAIRRRCALPALIGAVGLLATGVAAAEVKATEGWARATTPGAKSAAAYITFTNTGTEQRKLLKIVSTVSDEVSIMRTSITETGATRMWPMAVLAIEPGETLRMQPS